MAETPVTNTNTTAATLAPGAAAWPPSSSSKPSSLAPPPSRSANRQSSAVSFDKSILNLLKLDTHDLDIQDDALVVIDKEKRRKNRRSCLSNTVFRWTIPLYNVLWADVVDTDSAHRRIAIEYTESASKTRLRVAQLAVSLPPADAPDRPTVEDAAAWTALLRARAYGPAPQQRRALVLLNPHAGPGGALKKWTAQVEPVFRAARMQMTVVTTEYAGQAAELCQSLDLDATPYDMVVPCSGDGLAHEVFNGLGQRPDAQRALARLAVAHVPCGSGNAMACNLYGTHRAGMAALAIVKGVVAPLDLVSITQGDRRILSFLSQAVGIVAEADLATEHLRWMGEARFTWGFLQRFMAQKVYPCDLAVQVAFDDKDAVRAHYSRRQLRKKDVEHAKLASSTTTTAASSYDELLLAGTSLADESGSEAAASAAGIVSASGNDSCGDSMLDEGLPPLRFGTADDPLPRGWELVPQDKMGNFYCGNMAYMAPDANFFSAALMNDGLMDLITIDGDIPLHKSLAMVSSVENGHFFDNPLVHYRKIAAYRLVPKNQPDGYISIDGERVPFAPFQAEVHQGLGRVIARQTVGYAAPGPRDWDKVSAADRFRA